MFGLLPQRVSSSPQTLLPLRARFVDNAVTVGCDKLAGVMLPACTTMTAMPAHH